jgi:FkbM family methyltransferase
MAALMEIAKKIRQRGLCGTIRATAHRAHSFFNDSVVSFNDSVVSYFAYRFLRHAKGVIHVGAHEGQERDIYARHNLNVLWIEPLPDVFRKLQENISGTPRQTAENCLITDGDDKEYVFHVASNWGASSSIFELGDHSEIWPDIHYVDHLKMKSITLDSLMFKIRDDSALYDALVLDTQGSELLVLKGARRLLQQIKFIRAEAADFEVYIGGARGSDLDDYLAQFGFTPIRIDKFAESSKAGKCFDVLYRRK